MTTPQSDDSTTTSVDTISDGDQAFLVSRPLNLPQLESEIARRLDMDVNDLGLVVQGDPDSASDATPVKLWVVPGNLDRNAIQDVISAHSPDDTWNVSSFMQEYRAVVKKIRANPRISLSDTELRTLNVGNALVIDNARPST